MADSRDGGVTWKSFKKWMLEFPWLDFHPDESGAAYCMRCEVALTVKKCVLLKHSRSKAHLKTSEKEKVSTSIMLKENEKCRRLNEFQLNIGGVSKQSFLIWKKEFSWLDFSPDDKDAAYCVKCACSLTPKKGVLIKHQNSKGHIMSDEKDATATRKRNPKRKRRSKTQRKLKEDKNEKERCSVKKETVDSEYNCKDDITYEDDSDGVSESFRELVAIANSESTIASSRQRHEQQCSSPIEIASVSYTLPPVHEEPRAKAVVVPKESSQQVDLGIESLRDTASEIAGPEEAGQHVQNLTGVSALQNAFVRAVPIQLLSSIADGPTESLPVIAVESGKTLSSSVITIPVSRTSLSAETGSVHTVITVPGDQTTNLADDITVVEDSHNLVSPDDQPVIALTDGETVLSTSDDTQHFIPLARSGSHPLDGLEEGTEIIVPQMPFNVIGMQEDSIIDEIADCDPTSVTADAQYPTYIQAEMKRRLISGEACDCFWVCKDGKFRVHKFVLAISSPIFKECLHEDETESCIYTPDLNSIIVKSVICLFYTGSVMLMEQEVTKEIRCVLDSLGCSFSIFMEKYNKPQNKLDPLDLPFRVVRKKRKNAKIGKASEKTAKKIKLDSDPAVRSDPSLELDWNMADDFLYESDNTNDDAKIEVRQIETKMDDTKSQQQIKIEVEHQEDFVTEDLYHSDDDYIPTPPRSSQKSSLRPTTTDNKENAFPYFEGEYLLNGKLKERILDSRNRYYLKGNGKGKLKGLLSKDLGKDLFDNADDSLLGISVCSICYQYFQTKGAYRCHMIEKHREIKGHKRAVGPCQITETRFKCPKCEEEIEVGHIVWFVKHIKYCGVNDQKARAILGPKDVDVFPEDQGIAFKKELESDCFVYTKNRGKKIQDLSLAMFGQVTDSVWGCRTCYELFLTWPHLEDHRNEEHGGKLSHGACYDEQSSLYTCKFCKVSHKFTHLVYFIHHLKQCLVDLSNGPYDGEDEEEEEIDDDAFAEEAIDPWGVINKPLRVENQKSSWICEALFGKHFPIVYPCHVCYSVFAEEREIRDHFRNMHPDTENCVENGAHYNKIKDCFFCPVCKKGVCRNHRKTSVYFTYHLMKCLGKTFSVSRSCTKCSKSFASYRSFAFHVRNPCNMSKWLCHICSMALTSKARLQTHIRFVHSEARPHLCTQCDKSFKRESDLRVHEEIHKDVTFPCEKCGKIFQRRRNLKTHLKTHLPDSEKPHQCIYCSQRFSRKHTLDNHLATHEDVRRYKCDVCDMMVKTRETLRTHRKKVHHLTGPLPPPTVSATEFVKAETLPDVAAHADVSAATLPIAVVATSSVASSGIAVLPPAASASTDISVLPATATTEVTLLPDVAANTDVEATTTIITDTDSMLESLNSSVRNKGRGKGKRKMNIKNDIFPAFF